MNTASQSFGRRLQSGRERLGISLEAIAASTKISRSLLADLERGDVSKWPGGIYRRAFVREYAAIIGLSGDAVVAELLELFPEEETPAAARPVGTEPSTDLRLTLAVDRNQALILTTRRLTVATFELCAVLGLGWLVTTLTQSEFWTVCGAIALTYYPVAAACSTRVPAFRWPAVKALFALSARRHDVPSSWSCVERLSRAPTSAQRDALRDRMIPRRDVGTGSSPTWSVDPINRPGFRSSSLRTRWPEIDTTRPVRFTTGGSAEGSATSDQHG
jgi:transcriptional regulator with XRE-family HTH domain